MLGYGRSSTVVREEIEQMRYGCTRVNEASRP
jgi:hypothetical protein